MKSNCFPYQAGKYLADNFPDQEEFTANDMRVAFRDGCKTGAANTLACWNQKSQLPKAIPNQFVFVMCFSPDFGIEIKKVLTTEYKDFVEAHNDAIYWCYEYMIAPRKIRIQFMEMSNDRRAAETDCRCVH